jgi:hypothetical protein
VFQKWDSLPFIGTIISYVKQVAEALQYAHDEQRNHLYLEFVRAERLESDAPSEE